MENKKTFPGFWPPVKISGSLLTEQRFISDCFLSSCCVFGFVHIYLCDFDFHCWILLLLFPSYLQEKWQFNPDDDLSLVVVFRTDGWSSAQRLGEECVSAALISVSVLFSSSVWECEASWEVLDLVSKLQPETRTVHPEDTWALKNKIFCLIKHFSWT